MTKFKWNAGTISLLLLLLVIATFIPVNIWNSARYSQMTDDLGMGILMGCLAFFVWLPMLIASLVTGIVSLVKKRGQDQGIATLVGLFLIAIWIFSASH